MIIFYHMTNNNRDKIIFFSHDIILCLYFIPCSFDASSKDARLRLREQTNGHKIVLFIILYLYHTPFTICVPVCSLQVQIIHHVCSSSVYAARATVYNAQNAERN